MRTKTKWWLALSLCAGILGAGTAGAQTSGEQETESKETKEKGGAPQASAAQKRADELNRDFLGVKFGVAFGAITIADRVESAEIIGGKVVVTKETSSQPTVLLETHRLFDVQQGGRHRGTAEDGSKVNLERVGVGVGPFLALQSSQAEVIEGLGLGVMVGFRAGDMTSSFNIGVGAMLAPSVKTLAEGFVDGQEPPTGASEVRFKETSKWGLVVLASFAF